MDTGRRPLLSLYSKWDIYVLHQGIIVFLLANRTAQSVQIGCDYWNRCCRACNKVPPCFPAGNSVWCIATWVLFFRHPLILWWRSEDYPSEFGSWVPLWYGYSFVPVNRLSIRWLNEWQIYDLFKIDSKKYMDLLRAKSKSGVFLLRVKSKTCKYPVVAYFAYWLSKVCININETITL